MNQHILQQFKKNLLQEKKQLEEHLKLFNDEGLHISWLDSTSELSAYDNHPADAGDITFERSKDFALRENTSIMLGAVNEALEKIDKGTYGKCDVCGQEIGEERLLVRPATTVCYRCKAGDEEIPRMNQRPAEEDVLYPPFEKSFNDGTDDVMYDGEDAWQDVAGNTEHAENTGAGAYYGPSDMEEENRGSVENVDQIPYSVDEEGIIYQDFRGQDENPIQTEKH